MQLGTRWPAHTPAPQNLDQSVKNAVAEVEQALEALSEDTTSWFWTLTYLENRPVVQLDDGTTIRISAEGSVSVKQED